MKKIVLFFLFIMPTVTTCFPPLVTYIKRDSFKLVSLQDLGKTHFFVDGPFIVVGPFYTDPRVQQGSITTEFNKKALQQKNLDCQNNNNKKNFFFLLLQIFVNNCVMQ